MGPTMNPVVSSVIAAVGYDEPNSALYIDFNKGSRYRYTGVPASVFRSLLSAASKGSYFWRHIRDRYPTYRVR